MGKFYSLFEDSKFTLFKLVSGKKPPNKSTSLKRPFTTLKESVAEVGIFECRGNRGSRQRSTSSISSTDVRFLNDSATVLNLQSSWTRCLDEDIFNVPGMAHSHTIGFFTDIGLFIDSVAVLNLLPSCTKCLGVGIFIVPGKAQPVNDRLVPYLPTSYNIQY